MALPTDRLVSRTLLFVLGGMWLLLPSCCAMVYTTVLPAGAAVVVPTTSPASAAEPPFPRPVTASALSAWPPPFAPAAVAAGSAPRLNMKPVTGALLAMRTETSWSLARAASKKTTASDSWTLSGMLLPSPAVLAL